VKWFHNLLIPLESEKTRHRKPESKNKSFIVVSSYPKKHRKGKLFYATSAEATGRVVEVEPQSASPRRKNILRLLIDPMPGELGSTPCCRDRDWITNVFSCLEQVFGASEARGDNTLVFNGSGSMLFILYHCWIL